jgi:cullin 1
MWDAFQGLPDYDQDADLQRTYALLARIPEGLEPLRRQFEGHVKKAGLGVVASLVGGGEGGGGELDLKACVGETRFAARVPRVCVTATTRRRRAPG